ncbi:MAG: hypothetical protein LBL55_01310 [Propionibacteriaceae bacterium]|nr:hypothetical protein [Propionibacteriaceae bacterium]
MTDLAFLDANVLAKPFTRTLIVVGAAVGGADYAFAWSRYAESEANNHLRAQAKRLEVFRAERGIELSPTGAGSQGYASTDVKDRQIVVDAVSAGARWIVTENVSDFGWADLQSTGMIAIHYDWFLAEHLSLDAYRQGLGILSHGRVPVDVIHANVALVHPRLFAVMAGAFPGVEPVVSKHRPPRQAMRSPQRS